MLNRILSKLSDNPKLRQFVFYAVCGGTGVAIDLSCYSALVFSRVEYQLANAIGYASGTLVSFFLNRHFTFKTYDKTAHRLALFFATAGVGYAISSTMLWTFVSLLYIHPIPSKLMTLAVVLAVQFLINRAITFRAT